MLFDERLMEEVKLLRPQQSMQGPGDTVYLFPAIYSWTWNNKAKEVFDTLHRRMPKPIGVIAQELRAIGFQSYTSPVQVEDEVYFDVNTDALMKYSEYLGFNKKEEGA